MHPEQMAFPTHEELLHVAHDIREPGEQMVALFGLEARTRHYYGVALQLDEFANLGVFGDEKGKSDFTLDVTAEQTLASLHFSKDRVRSMYSLGQLANGLKKEKLFGEWSGRQIRVEALDLGIEPFTYDIGGFGNPQPTDKPVQGKLDLRRYSDNFPAPQDIGNLYLSENRPVGPSVTTFYTARLVDPIGEPLTRVEFL